MANSKKRNQSTSRKVSSPEATNTVSQSLDEFARQAIAEKLSEILEQEVQEYLGRCRYEHHGKGQEKHYRNGFGKQRHVTVGSGPIPVQVPRLRETYESKIIGRYQRVSDEVKQTLPELYAHGLATGDFSMSLDILLGDKAPLSETSIIRLKSEWKQEYQQWQKRELEEDYLYVWVDGVYPKAGPKDENMALLVVVGLNSRGHKEILAIEEGYRESIESWRDVFRCLKKRGIKWIGMVVADGIDSVWKAIRDVFPKAKKQRCWVHKMRNVVDKVPKHAHDEVLEDVRDIYYARSREQAMQLKQEFIEKYQSLYPRAVASLEEAGEMLFEYFDFPKTHWKSIKSTNVIESMFATVKLRTDAARRIPKRESATYLVFKVLTNAQQRFNRIQGYKLVSKTIEKFKA